MLIEDSKALLGSIARSWHAALWHRTDECQARGQSSLLVLTALLVQAKKHHQGLSASCFPKFLQRAKASLWRTSSNSACPSKEWLSFLGRYVTLLKNLLEGKDGYSSENDRDTSSV